MFLTIGKNHQQLLDSVFNDIKNYELNYEF